MNKVELIQSWVRAGQSPTLALKETLESDLTEIIGIICAMGNLQGGTLVIGVTANRELKGIDFEFEQDKYNNLIKEVDTIIPPIFITCERLELDNGRTAILIIVPPVGEQLGTQNYSHNCHTYNRHIWLDTEGHKASTVSNVSKRSYIEGSERLCKKHRWENKVSSKCTFEDLDHDLIMETLEDAIKLDRMEPPKKREPWEVLKALGLTEGENIVNGAVALFLKEAVLNHWDKVRNDEYAKSIRHFPQLYFEGKFIKKKTLFRVNDTTGFKTEADGHSIHGNIFNMFEEAIKFYESIETSHQGHIRPEGPVEELAKSEYLFNAYKEAILNAICHRDYSSPALGIVAEKYKDRIEIKTHGGFAFGVNRLNVFSLGESRARNPLIASVLYKRGLITADGSGMLRMKTNAIKSGLAAPILENETSDLKLTLGTLDHESIILERELAEKMVLSVLRVWPKGLTIAELKGEFQGLPDSLLEDALYQLQNGGQVARDGIDRPWQCIEVSANMV